MDLTDAEITRINAASQHIHDALAKSIEQMHRQITQKFRISGAQLNVAIARAAILTMAVCAASAASSEGDSEDAIAEVAKAVTEKVERILYKTIGVEL